MEISPRVHVVQLLGARGHLVLEPEITLIDAGLPGSAPRVRGYILAQGRSADDLVRIVCTHGHPDHAGGARGLLHDGVKLLMHPADYAGLQVSLRDALRRPSRGRLFASITPTPARFAPVEDGDVLPVLGGLEVIHTPGHTPGSICLYARRDRLLFVGDILQRRGGRVTYASTVFSDDPASARTSLRRLTGLDVQTIVFAHYPPVRQGANELLKMLAGAASRPHATPGGRA
jgi:glyoxylase-like metal-dependent hydrolase (beta-lactamase superfamily II)